MRHPALALVLLLSLAVATPWLRSEATTAPPPAWGEDPQFLPWPDPNG